MTTVYLIRHSIKMKGPVGGQDPVFDHMQPLSAEGEERAKQLLEIPELRGADFAMASTMSRSLATLRYLIEADQVPYGIDDRLRELDFGRMPGTKPGEFRPGAPGMDDFRARQWLEPDLKPEDGESIAQCRQRMSDAIVQTVSEHPNQKILVGSHGAAICAYLSGVLEGVDDSFVRTVNQPDAFCLTFEGTQVIGCSRLTLPFPMPTHPGGKGGPPPAR